MEHPKRFGIVIGVLASIVVFASLVVLADVTVEAFREDPEDFEFADLTPTYFLGLLPIAAAWSLWRWKSLRLDWIRIRKALGDDFEKPTFRIRRVASLLTSLLGWALLALFIAGPFGEWIPGLRGLNTAVLFNGMTVSFAILLIALPRLAVYRAHIRTFEKRRLERAEKRLTKCESYCRESKNPKTRISRAQLGVATLPLVVAFRPRKFAKASRLEAYFRAVERCAELDESLQRMHQVQTARAKESHRANALAELERAPLTDEELRLAEVAHASGDPYTMEELRALLDRGDAQPMDSSNVQEEDAMPSTRQDLGPELATGGPARWVPAGEEVQVQGFVLPGGMLYVGGELIAAEFASKPDPALIDPTLRLDPTSPARSGKGLPYWPSYDELTARQRAAYLEWIAEGRGKPETPIGYVFLFFYGLERRLGFDLELNAETVLEWVALRGEITRLLAIYGKHESFHGYATSLLQWTEFKLRALGSNNEFELGVEAESALDVGVLARDGKPIPAQLALDWAQHSESFRWRTPARRCPDEFRALFTIRYAEAFGEGLLVEASSPRLERTHRPASPGFTRVLRAEIDLPDAERDERFRARLGELLEACTEELAAYSRHAQDGFQLASIGLLPREIAREFAGEAGAQLTAELDMRMSSTDTARVAAADLRRYFPPSRGERWRKSEFVRVAQTLDRFGIGLEPDVRFGAPTPKSDADVELFRLSKGAPTSPSEEYSRALALVHLTAAVASAEGALLPEEERAFEERVEERLDLSENERCRLRAHLRWRVRERPDLAGLRKKLELLDDQAREASAQFLLSIAAADGQVSAAELKALEKLYALLGLDPQRLHSDLHQFTMQSPSSSEATTRADEEPGGLDAELVARKHRETMRVSRLLADIFEEETVEPDPAPAKAASSVPGLDAQHAALFHALRERESWPRDDFEALSSDLGMFPGGALEALNEAAFEQFDMPLTEGDDPIELVPETVQEFLK